MKDPKTYLPTPSFVDTNLNFSGDLNQYQFILHLKSGTVYAKYSINISISISETYCNLRLLNHLAMSLKLHGRVSKGMFYLSLMD